jgi:hypothetical protein
MNFKSAGERTMGQSCMVMFLEEIHDAHGLLKLILKGAKFVILAERANLSQPKDMELECWIDFSNGIAGASSFVI